MTPMDWLIVGVVLLALLCAFAAFCAFDQCEQVGTLPPAWTDEDEDVLIIQERVAVERLIRETQSTA